MSDLSNLIIGLGIVAVVLMVCGVIVLAYVVSAWGTIRRELLGKREERDVHLHPSPITVTEQTQFATRDELEAVGAQVQVVDADLKTLRREIVENGEKRRASIEGKVEASRKECREHTEHVRIELSEKLDGMEGRIIATLKNTGAI